MNKYKKTIGFVVPINFKYKGTKMRKILDEFFQYIVDNVPEIVLNYPNFEEVREILENWNKIPSRSD